jgi:hypothetical protein
MKNVLIVTLLIGLFSSLGIAQVDPIPPPRRVAAPKVGLFIGFTPGWLNVNVAPINEFLVGAGAAPLSDNGIMLYGGAGAIYILVIKNFRVGGMGMSGTSSSSITDPTDGVRRDAELGMGFGGLTFEYVFPVARRFDIAVGSMIGWGSMNLTLRQNLGGNNTWSGEQEIFGTWPPTTLTNLTRRLSGSYFTLVPAVNFEYAPLGWLGLRLGASYVLMAFPSWNVDGEYDLTEVPDAVKGNGFMINAGVFVGTF